MTTNAPYQPFTIDLPDVLAEIDRILLALRQDLYDITHSYPAHNPGQVLALGEFTSAVDTLDSARQSLATLPHRWALQPPPAGSDWVTIALARLTVPTTMLTEVLKLLDERLGVESGPVVDATTALRELVANLERMRTLSPEPL